MTTPSERTRALRWAGEFLRDIRANHIVDQALRDQAHGILRHYPDIYEIELLAKINAVDPFISLLSPEPSSSAQESSGNTGKTNESPPDAQNS